MKSVIIIGGGMAGLSAAVMLAKKNIKVTILERQEKVGKKIYLTGNGKCNIANKNLSEAFFVCDSNHLLSSTIEKFGYFDILNFWKDLGVLTKEKNDYVYPSSNQAATVVTALEQRCRKLGVAIYCNSFVTQIHKTEEHLFCVKSENKEFISDYVILACGGMAGIYKEESLNGYRLARNIGHNVNYCYPALVQMITSENFKDIHGVRCDASAKLYISGDFIAEEYGEIQFTEKFISGIPVFQLSRYIKDAFKAQKEVALCIDLIGQREEEWLSYITNRADAFTGESVKSFYNGILNEKLNLYFINKANLLPDAIIGKDISEESVVASAMTLLNWRLRLVSVNSFKNAQISTGGIPCDEVSENFKSKVTDGLYIVGEMLDVAGACGGYNLYFAASSGIISAGEIATEAMQL